MRRGSARSWLGVVLAAALAWAPPVYAHHPQSSPPRATARRELRLPIRDFSLIDQDERPFRFRSLKGKAVLAGFIYTTCPDVCPLITASMRMVQEGLGAEERRSVVFLSITTDPEIDKPPILKSYAGRYKIDLSNWSFLTGDLDSLGRVWKTFGVKVERKARGLVDHTSLTGLIDGKGTLRYAYSGGAPDHRGMLQDIRRLLRER